jgi:hypothetical protein
MLYCDEGNKLRLYALPSGDLIRSFDDINGSTPWNFRIEWTPKGDFFVIHGPKLQVFRTETGREITSYDVSEPHLFFYPDGNGFVALSSQGWQLMATSFTTRAIPVLIPLPGRPAQKELDADAPANAGTVYLRDIATNNNGSVVIASFDRSFREGDANRSWRYLARWDAPLQQWLESRIEPDSFYAGVNLCLRTDPYGRYATTKSVWFPLMNPDSSYCWGEDEVAKHANRYLWKVSGSAPTCLNDHGFPPGYVFFDPKGSRIVVVNEETPRTTSVYDAVSLSLISRFETLGERSEPEFSADGKWAAFEETIFGLNSNPGWYSSWVPNWLLKRFEPPDRLLRIIRLGDGKTVRKLNHRSIQTFASDGSLWTVTSSEDDDTIAVERWSPEPPTPWWMIIVSACTFALIIWDFRVLSPQRQQGQFPTNALAGAAG